MALFPMTFPFYFDEIPAEVPPGNQVIAGPRVRTIVSTIKAKMVGYSSRIDSATGSKDIRAIYAGERIIGV